MMDTTIRKHESISTVIQKHVIGTDIKPAWMQTEPNKLTGKRDLDKLTTRSVHKYMGTPGTLLPTKNSS